jgi:hypothetical protein
MLLCERGIFQGLPEEVREVGGTLEVEEVLGTLEGCGKLRRGGNTLARERNIPGGWRKFGRKWIGPEGSLGVRGVPRDSAEVKCSFVDGGRGYWDAEDIPLSG